MSLKFYRHMNLPHRNLAKVHIALFLVAAQECIQGRGIITNEKKIQLCSLSMCPDLGLDHKQCVTFFENEESMNWEVHREEIMEFTCRCNPRRPSRRSACKDQV